MPVKALNKVDFPVFGFPTRATVKFAAADELGVSGAFADKVQTFIHTGKWNLRSATLDIAASCFHGCFTTIHTARGTSVGQSLSAEGGSSASRS